MGSTAQFVILGMLSKEPMTGYDIRKRVKTRMGSFWDINYGQIYPTLRTLEKKGEVTKKVEIMENRPNRKVYSITNKGLNELKKWLLKPAEPESAKIETLLKVAFGEHLSKDEIIKHINEFKARNISRLEDASNIEKEMKAQLKKNEKYFFPLLTFSLGKSLHKAGIEWADTAIELIEKHKNFTKLYENGKNKISKIN
ncbi:PadR family transcriptional regulator [Candidatus Bathyarchaeota archaeon]|nr:PadR family transcriptional regulator [Candidatus Bathyarchaeota archaeon]